MACLQVTAASSKLLSFESRVASVPLISAQSQAQLTSLRPSLLQRAKPSKSAGSSRRPYASVHASDASSSTSTATSATPSSNAGKVIIPDSEISITKTSFGTIALTVGIALLSWGFGAYFTILPGLDFSALMLTYGFPLSVIGSALKYAELKPVPCVSYADAVALREKQATPILVQVRSDVTRYRYGDEQHLEEALKRIFRYNQAGGIQRRFAPTLTAIAEEVFEGHYSLRLTFVAPELKLADFVNRQAKFTSFFGPDVNATVDLTGKEEYSVRLTSTLS